MQPPRKRNRSKSHMASLAVERRKSDLMMMFKDRWYKSNILSRRAKTLAKKP
jgi:hypothetical protein